MLYNLEPDRTVTGGAWYSDQDFESEFVEVLNQQCYKFLVQKVRRTFEVIFPKCYRIIKKKMFCLPDFVTDLS